ncbi:MAG: outer membrane lipoprotein-sorting protein [bacterium]|nr:outer membrane lipoprotein-sorting protein [bacterium]
MRMIFNLVAVTLLSVGLTVAAKLHGEQEPLTATQIVERSQLAFYYQGHDMKAQVTMELISRDGRRRTRVMTMLRRDETEGGNQKYFIYFHEPGDVRRMTFMVWKYPTKEDDRWIFIPAVDLIRRIAADDKRSSFVGSDFTYEDVSGRDVASDTHTLLRSERLGDRDCYVIQSVPKERAEYTKRLSWIDKKTFLPIREEYYDAQNELFRVFTADKIEPITVGDAEEQKSFPTVTGRTMKNEKTGHRTEVTFKSVSYNLGVKDEDFGERNMRVPPGSWIR